jgi:methylated-DNA-[protein]-cysteine S-methyltransferase
MADGTMRYAWYDSPVGGLLLAGDPDGLTLISFPSGSRRHSPAPGWQRDEDLLAPAIVQLAEYFAGTRRSFSLPLRPAGTAFQQSVWAALRQIPFGATISYGELARRVGRPAAARAVGAANGANPLPIVVPCHRVIGADDSLTGFGGGLETKHFLLAHEARLSPTGALQGELFG